ncbi:NifB/NifX family molybdenum-iron cluster-binding protein [Desulfoplanes sp.]
MRLCLACYGTRLAVVFDNASEFRLYDVEDEHICPAGHISLPFGDLPSKVSSIVSCGVNTLICGGISGCTLRLITSTDVEVIPWICGQIDTVLTAWQNNDLEELAMPGCKGQCRGGRGQGRGRRFGHARQHNLPRTNKHSNLKQG